MTVIRIGGKILVIRDQIHEPFVFDVDHVRKARSELSIAVVEKKYHKITA